MQIHGNIVSTVAILAQGTHWALAAKQAFCLFLCYSVAKLMHSGETSHPLRPKLLCCFPLCICFLLPLEALRGPTISILFPVSPAVPQ